MLARRGRRDHGLAEVNARGRRGSVILPRGQLPCGQGSPCHARGPRRPIVDGGAAAHAGCWRCEDLLAQLASARPRRGAAPRWRAARAGASSPGAIPNLSYRLARCCLTAAWVMTSSSAIARVDAGSVNMSRASSGRHRATSTSRSRVVSAGGGLLGLRRRAGGGQRIAEHEPRLADADLVAVSQPPRGPDTLAVDPRPVRGSEVGHAPAGRKPLEHRVQVARRRVVGERDVVLGGLADGRAFRRELEAPAAHARDHLDLR